MDFNDQKTEDVTVSAIERTRPRRSRSPAMRMVIAIAGISLLTTVRTIGHIAIEGMLIKAE